VLGERLETLLDVQAELDDAKKEIAELNARLDIWQAEAVELQRQFDAIDVNK
jgi:prefoldin subunit 5